MAVMHESIDDPQLVAAANVFVDDIIETAKVEAAQRTMILSQIKDNLYTLVSSLSDNN
ncbi:hypothetical protein QTP88_002951 [Uroleucon formosanum]